MSKLVHQNFIDRYPLIGPTFWIVSVQYVFSQLYVAAGWINPSYSWANNAISDLGNTACGIYSNRIVCSPRHYIMNTSFIVLGATMIAGSLLIYREFHNNRFSFVSFIGMGLAGFGTILVGVFPENTVAPLHATGAVLALLIGNLAIVGIGVNLPIGRVLRLYTVLSGAIALLAFFLYVTNHNLGLGMGGMERLAGYPQTLWLIIFGLYMTRNHVSHKS
jgi:hypothetical membrane protein